jgi:mono/diheme cytochrome c family protein
MPARSRARCRRRSVFGSRWLHGSCASSGEQYVAVVAGWAAVWCNCLCVVLNLDGAKCNISRILAYETGGNAELPSMPGRAASVSPPESFGSEAQIKAGGRLTMRYCAGCHGVGAATRAFAASRANPSPRTTGGYASWITVRRRADRPCVTAGWMFRTCRRFHPS